MCKVDVGKNKNEKKNNNKIATLYTVCVRVWFCVSLCTNVRLPYLKNKQKII